MPTTLKLTGLDQKAILSGIFHSAMLNTLFLGMFDLSVFNDTKPLTVSCVFRDLHRTLSWNNVHLWLEYSCVNHFISF